MDARIALIEIIHKEFNSLQTSLEFTQSQILTLTQENAALKKSVNTLTVQMESVSKENKQMKDTIIDLQCRSMRDNLIFTGIPEQPSGVIPDPEQAVKDFIINQLKIPSDTANQITFHRVHRLGVVNKEHPGPRPIIAKFEHYKQKEEVKMQGVKLKDTHFGMNDQFPKIINDRRKVLFPLRKKFRDDNKKAVISVDKLYVDGKLFKDREKTPWLY